MARQHGQAIFRNHRLLQRQRFKMRRHAQSRHAGIGDGRVAQIKSTERPQGRKEGDRLVRHAASRQPKHREVGSRCQFRDGLGDTLDCAARTNGVQPSS